MKNEKLNNLVASKLSAASSKPEFIDKLGDIIVTKQELLNDFDKQNYKVVQDQLEELRIGLSVICDVTIQCKDKKAVLDATKDITDKLQNKVIEIEKEIDTLSKRRYEMTSALTKIAGDTLALSYKTILPVMMEVIEEFD